MAHVVKNTFRLERYEPFVVWWASRIEHRQRSAFTNPTSLHQLVQPNAPDYLAFFYKPLIDLFFFTSTRAV